MNKEVARVLKNYIKDLPFVDLIAGLVQTVRIKIPVGGDDGGDKLLETRIPVSYDTEEGIECIGKERELIPNSDRKSIIYFEDYGSTPNKDTHGLIGMDSKLRLVCWLNRALLVGDTYAEVTTPAMGMILNALPMGNPVNKGDLTRLRVSASHIPIQDASIFGKYTYEEAETQYLRPPYEFFAIDLQINFTLSPKCGEKVNWNNPITC